MRNIATIQNDSAVKKIIADTYGRFVKKKEYSTAIYNKYSMTSYLRILSMAEYDSEKRQAFFALQRKHENEIIDSPITDSLSRGYKQKCLGVFFISYPFENDVVVEFQLMSVFYGFECSKLVSSKRVLFLFRIDVNGNYVIKNYCIIDKVNKCQVID